MSATTIEWATHVWNPVTGCDKVSPGCAHCYAETFAERWRGIPGHPYEQGFDLRLWPERLEAPLRWRKPRRVFVNSMSDLFHHEIPNEFIAAVFGVMAFAEQHTFMVLTKRPDRAKAWFEWYEGEANDRELLGVDPSTGISDMPADVGFQEARGLGLELGEAHGIPWPLPNVCLGVSIENRRFVDRADILRQTPAAVRFISAEPLLGPLLGPERFRLGDGREVTGWPSRTPGAYRPSLDLAGIDWLIVVGESGPRHRPIDPEWVRDLRDGCLERRDDCERCGSFGVLDMFGGPGAGAEFGHAPVVKCPDCPPAFFFKQWGGRTPKAGGRELDGRTWDELPSRARSLEVADV